MNSIGKKCIKLYNLNIYFNLKGKYKNCCYQDDSCYKDFSGIGEIQKSPLISEIRRYMSDGREHSSCAHCYNYEKQGIKSPREIYNENYTIDTGKDFPTKPSEFPKELFIRFSNLCNFACRMCNTDASTGRKQLDVELFGQDAGLRQLPEDVLQQLYDTEFLKNLEVMDIKGGEPFLHVQHFQLLDYLIQNNLCKNIVLKYNSNLSILPGVNGKGEHLIPEGYTDIFDMWRHFKSIMMRVSIEGYGDDNDYIRIGAKWSDIERHLDIISAQENIKVILFSTIQPDNLLYIPKMILFAQKKDIFLGIGSHSFVYSPEYYDVKYLPQEVKAYVERFYEKCKKKYPIKGEYRQNLDDIVTYMKEGNYDRDIFLEYLRVSSKTDQISNLKKKDTMLEVISKLIKNREKV